MSGLFPVYEFRPLAKDCHGTVERYNGGNWIADDGEWDIAFVAYGMFAPLGLYVEIPYQRNIIWRGLTSHWSAENYDHPRVNPWHYMLRHGETEWGGSWDRHCHPNEMAGRKAMAHCCSINGCANGRGPKFEIDDPYVAAGLLRDSETKELVEFPTPLVCMYCGDRWQAKIDARAEKVA